MLDGKQRDSKGSMGTSITHRNIVKKVATVGALASIPATAGATSDSDVPRPIDGELDLDFDPKKKDQAAKFVMNSLSLDNEDKNNIQSNYSIKTAQ